MDNVEESQVTKLNKIEVILIISPKKIISYYSIIQIFF